MNYKKYYLKNTTYISYLDPRLNKIVNLVKEHNPNNILDVGCGDGFLLSEIKKRLPDAILWGVDVYKTKKKGIDFKIADITKGLPFETGSLDCVIMGEIIEHVPDPDFVFKEVNRILKKKGMLIISTPNLVSWANRIMVLFGIQPFFTETSSEVNLGRYLKILGQGCKVQGHLKVFTHKSLEELLRKEKFKVIEKHGSVFYFPWPISLVDRFFSNFVSLSSDLLYMAKK